MFRGKKKVRTLFCVKGFREQQAYSTTKFLSPQ